MIKRTIYFGNPEYLSTHNKQLVVRLPEVEKCDSLSEVSKRKATATIPIEDIGVVVLDHKQITISHGLINHLLANNCALISCDNNHMPTGLILPLDGNSIQGERFYQQINMSLPLKKQLWQQTIQAKISNQRTVLQRYRKDVKIGNMRKWECEVRSGDAMNLEARAAAYYWKNVFPSIPGFVRGRDEAPPNQLLNYGYAILRAVIARALVGAGLLPTLGIHHHNRYNAYCLADDIMEPYRPYIDEIVINMVDNNNYDTLSTKHKQEFLQLPVKEVVINGKRSPLMIAAHTTAVSLQKCIAGETRKIAYPTM